MSRPTLTRRVSTRWLPVVLAALGVALLIGCFPVPWPRRVMTGRDFRPIVSGKEHAALLRSDTSRAEIESVLGPPTLWKDDGLTVGYVLDVQEGSFIWPLCFSGEPRWGSYLLRLHYDDRGLLLDWKAEKRASEYPFFEYTKPTWFDQFPWRHPQSEPASK